MTPVYAIALILAANSATTAATSSGIPAAKAAKPEKAKKICKNDSRVTGTRISKRICKTEEEWAKGEDGLEVQAKGHAGNPQPVCMMCKENP